MTRVGVVKVSGAMARELNRQEIEATVQELVQYYEDQARFEEAQTHTGPIEDSPEPGAAIRKMLQNPNFVNLPVAIKNAILSNGLTSVFYATFFAANGKILTEINGESYVGAAQFSAGPPPAIYLSKSALEFEYPMVTMGILNHELGHFLTQDYAYDASTRTESDYVQFRKWQEAMAIYLSIELNEASGATQMGYVPASKVAELHGEYSSGQRNFNSLIDEFGEIAAKSKWQFRGPGDVADPSNFDGDPSVDQVDRYISQYRAIVWRPNS